MVALLLERWDPCKVNLVATSHISIKLTFEKIV
jgi:hypothetical protein